MLTITDEMVERALGAVTEELPEGVQYALIRGLKAMGWEIAITGSHDVMRAALTAALEGREEPDIARIRAEAVAEERERIAAWLGERANADDGQTRPDENDVEGMMRRIRRDWRREDAAAIRGGDDARAL